MAPDLSKMGNKNPFGTPEGYFDSFSERMQARLEEEEIKSTPEMKMGIFKILKPYLAMAAIFVGAFVMIYWPVQYISNRNDMIAEVESEEYIEEQLEWGSLFEFASFTDESTDEELLDDTQIEDYLVASASDFDIYFE